MAIIQDGILPIKHFPVRDRNKLLQTSKLFPKFGVYSDSPMLNLGAVTPVDVAHPAFSVTSDWRPHTGLWRKSEEPPHYSRTGVMGFSGGPGFSGPFSKTRQPTYKMHGVDGPVNGATGPSIPVLSSSSKSGFGGFGQTDIVSSILNFFSNPLWDLVLIAGLVVGASYLEKKGAFD